MILGIGSDIIEMRRIKRVLDRHKNRFLERVFTPEEQRRCEGRGMLRIASYARRFAAKEACAKALGTGLRNGVFWRDMGVVNLKSGKPSLQLSGGALQTLRTLTPNGMKPHIELTIADEPPFAQATVIIWASS